MARTPRKRPPRNGGNRQPAAMAAPVPPSEEPVGPGPGLGTLAQPVPPPEEPVGSGPGLGTLARPVPPPRQPVGRGPGLGTVQSAFGDHPLRTGRKLIRVTPGEHKAVEALMKDRTSLRLHPADAGAVAAAALPAARGGLATGEGIYFERLGILTVNADPDQAARLAALSSEDNPIDGEEWERYVFAGADPTYLQGYRAGVNGLIENLLAGGAATGPGSAAGPATAGVAFADDNRTAWGLKAMRADATRLTGKGVKLAILDTGIDLTHTDFAGRITTHASFIDGVATVRDGHGHGTHCAGIAGGPMSPARRPRYGVATEALLHIGKVLGDDGVGTDTSILGGIQWALDQGCSVISMSLGAPVGANQPRSQAFERVGRQALEAGAVIIAAAGNDSDRPGRVERVSHPANCRNFLAVAALDQRLRIASFSNGSLEPDGGQVDFAAPGVDIVSAIPGGYGPMSGTSMATPFVAGVAALLLEQERELRGHALIGHLFQRSLRLAASSADAGGGLPQAP